MGTAKGLLRARLRINEYDADDIAMEALLKTCLREPLPDDLRAYFFAVVRNQGLRAVVSARRTTTYGDIDEHAAALACSIELPEHREAKLELVWQYARCVLDDQAVRVLRSRLVDGLPFRDIGARWGISERRAHDIFHNALKKLRRELADGLP